MKLPYEFPVLNKTSFNCPHCKAFSSMFWSNAGTYSNPMQWIEDLKISRCKHCEKYSLWIKDSMIYPSDISVESPNEDLPEDIKDDYLEAANILNLSPRGAAALLRLSIEKLVNHLEVEGKDLNSKIGSLVSKRLDPLVQKSLDIVRVIGNEAVHPGQIDIKDNPEIARSLFRLVNMITEEMITKPNKVSALYQELIPEKQKQGIVKRDSE